MSVTMSNEVPNTSVSTVQGTCHHDCPDSCGWIVTVEDRADTAPVAVKLRGWSEHPYSAGELCPKVNRFLDRVYSPERILHPLRRVGAKGSGEFKQVTWPEALTEISTNLHRIINEHGPEAVLPYSDAGNQSLISLMGLSGRFFGHMGATKLERAICGVTVGAGMSKTIGSPRGLDPMEHEHSKLIILWGTNTKLTNRHLWPTIETARANGATLIVIDPIRTLTADAIDTAAGDQFIQPLPGTDIAMMLAMMHVLIGDGLTNDDWIANHTLGFDELCAAVADWTPERAAGVCGVEAHIITRLAHEYATLRPAGIRTLVGPEHHENGAMFHRTLACLPALTGAWAERGGGLSKSTGAWTESHIDFDAMLRPDIHVGNARTLNMSRLGQILTRPHAGQTDGPGIHAFINWNCNPIVTTPNAEATRRGLLRDDLFTVVHEQFMTDTARYADIVLPATTQIEADDVVLSWGSLHINYNHAAIDPPGETVNNTELFRRLAAAMGYTEPALFDDDAKIMREALPAIDIDSLSSSGWLRVDYPDDGRPFGEGNFDTPTGRVHFASDELEAMGQPRVPTYVAPNESPGGDATFVAEFPLQLLTPKHHARFLNSGYSHLPRHGPAEGGPFVELSDVDAAHRQLADGDVARVWNERGSIEVPVKITGRLRPGVIAIPWGWWSAHHPDGKTVNALTNDTLTEWGGGVAFSDTLVEVGHPN
ncbi:molybdopterin-dependent oxidoreductase [uncultured Ilumatobacter sp.]|uniref:molybdopterin-containing oxidoreductase family protein n=1 Tax=uncultured Ilumatobacter sp. TaxID=879968 RepID=UPI00374F8DE8